MNRYSSNNFRHNIQLQLQLRTITTIIVPDKTERQTELEKQLHMRTGGRFCHGYTLLVVMVVAAERAALTAGHLVS